MSDKWRTCGVAAALVVLLRVAIGWQFLYEGLWKYDTLSTAKPWTSAGYLRTAQGPLRNVFRNMTGDPDDLQWLDYDVVAARWDAWKSRFLTTYPDLTDDQKAKLNELIEGVEQFSVPLAKLPAGFAFSKSLEGTISYDAEGKRLVVDGKRHLIPREKQQIEQQLRAKKQFDTPEGKEFRKALDRVSTISARLSYKEKLVAFLKGDPELVGQQVKDEKTQQELEYREGKIAQYRVMLKRFADAQARARQTFEHQHLQAQAEEIQKARNELVSPVRALDTDMKHDARKLLTASQLNAGAVPEYRSRQYLIDRATIWALIGFGVLLIAGLFSRLAAVGGALLLISFYLAAPPWPSVPDFGELGPEHSFIVNKNLIEAIALLAIAAMPTGQWFGVDRLFAGCCGRRCRGSSTPVVALNAGGTRDTKTPVSSGKA